MKYSFLSLCDLLAPIRYGASVALGGAIPVHLMFRVKKALPCNQIKCIRRFASGCTFYFQTERVFQNMKRKKLYILSILIVILAALTSIGGLLLPGMYRDNLFVKTTWLGNDAVTLFIAVPILVAALVYSARGSFKAQLIWMGMLDYMLYNYAFYLFGAAFNVFFLMYAALLALSIIALIFGLANLDVNRISGQIKKEAPVKWIGGYFLFVASGLGLVYLIQSIGFIATGTVPAIVTISGHPTNVVFALDLTLLIPWLILGALWLMKRQP